MYLSKIEIIGFKSFAQRTNVSFDTGVTAIVGPNGCGKTNIVDAIRWALGEQRYSTLRSDKMEDVIFNGTKNRKPLGLAEVSLTIENSKGILPSEYTEVTITRRVFRSGESEYLLNKVPCRLKDILTLFMDTGMGSDAYSVIELKMVETILSDKTDERRKLFEEAAGVTKYKFRRKAALKKLEDVQQDLSRVNDIVKEVQKTVNSLERQAKKAEQYNEINTRLKSLEVDLLEREYAYLHAKLSPLESKFALAQTDRQSIDAALRAQEDEIETLRSGLREIEASLRESQENVSRQLQSIHRVEEKILVANERLNSLKSNIERYEKEKADLSSQRDTITLEEENLRRRQEQLTSELSALEQALEISRSEHERLSTLVEERKSTVESLKQALLDLAHATIQRRGEQERLRGRIDNLKGRIDRASEDVALYESDIATNTGQITELTAKDRELRRQFAEGEVRLANEERAKREVADSITSLKKQAFDLQNESDRKISKIEFIKDLIENNEGYSEGTRYLLGHDSWKAKNIRTVADSIEVPEKYRVAIEAALGEAANYLVVDTMQDGYAAFEELKQRDKGKATIIALETIPRVHRHTKRNPSVPYVWATDVVKCEQRLQGLVDVLLGDVVIVDALGVTNEIFSKLITVRCISTDGHVVASTGVLRGGSRRHDEGGNIGKTAMIAELELEVESLTRQRNEVESQIAARLAEHDAMDLKPLREDVKSIEKEMTAIEMRIAQLEFEKKRANDGIDRNKTEILTLEHEIIDLRHQHERATTELESLEQQKVQKEQFSTQAIQEFEALELEFAGKTKVLKGSEIQLLTLQGEARNVGRDLERAGVRLEDIRVTLLRRDEEIAHAGEEIIRLSTESNEHEKEVTNLRAALETLEAGKSEIESTYGEKRNALHQIELRIKDERRLHDDSVAAAHDLEMKISEIKSNIEHIRQRSIEEFGFELSLKQYPEDEFVDFAQLRDEVKNLKERIKVMGAINFAAFDEFTTESERLKFLTQQRDDLLEAEKTLLSTIEEINTTAQRIFSETFSKIRENFITIFKELFMEGDECDLRLEEGVDPLEARIEIIAKPRGKRPTSIDLLSGGEKTLTAIALLFAIYLVKPSPFCILDEVDAPLDDSNIDRYTRILKKFSGNTQFIVVTHNKRTMEAAQALYGVTMEEEGISKLVTVRFNEEARVRSATLSA